MTMTRDYYIPLLQKNAVFICECQITLVFSELQALFFILALFNCAYLLLGGVKDLKVRELITTSLGLLYSCGQAALCQKLPHEKPGNS